MIYYDCTTTHASGMQGVGTYGETNHGQLSDPATPKQALNIGLAL